MDIEIAKGSGFCPGVRRAVRLALQAAEQRGRTIVTLGPLVHNPLVVEMLEARGIRAVDGVDGDADVVVVRAHGIPAPLHESLRRQRVEIVDATCPRVRRSQQYARALRDEGYRVVILGDADHAEVRAVGSYAGDRAVVVESPEALPAGIGPKVGLLAQTTQPQEAFLRLVGRAVPTAGEVRVINTICRSTASRLAETERLARRVQVMIVIGGRRSHNTLELARACLRAGVDTHHVERAGELQGPWFWNVRRVGVTAGASTPDGAIGDVVDGIRALETAAGSPRGAPRLRAGAGTTYCPPE